MLETIATALGEQFLSWAGALVVLAGGPAAVTLAIVKIYGDRWLTARFNRQVESLKHDQQREIESLRSDLNTALDRKVKLHQQEFSAIPELWRSLTEAHASVASLVSPLQSFTDVRRMTDEQLTEHLESLELTPTQRRDIMDSDDRLDRYQLMTGWLKNTKAREKYSTFHRTVMHASIWLPDGIQAHIDAIDDLLWSALVENETNLDTKATPRLREDREKLFAHGPGYIKELREALRLIVRGSGQTASLGS